MVISKKSIIFQGFRGSNIFQGGGVQIFQGGGVQVLISIETHITCDFPGEGVLNPYPPLWIRTCLPVNVNFYATNSKLKVSRTREDV